MDDNSSERSLEVEMALMGVMPHLAKLLAKRGLRAAWHPEALPDRGLLVEGKDGRASMIVWDPANDLRSPDGFQVSVIGPARQELPDGWRAMGRDYPYVTKTSAWCPDAAAKILDDAVHLAAACHEEDPS